MVYGLLGGRDHALYLVSGSCGIFDAIDRDHNVSPLNTHTYTETLSQSSTVSSIDNASHEFSSHDQTTEPRGRDGPGFLKKHNSSLFFLRDEKDTQEGASMKLRSELAGAAGSVEPSEVHLERCKKSSTP